MTVQQEFMTQQLMGWFWYRWIMWSGDPDDDNDNALDENDTDDFDPFVCSDTDEIPVMIV